MILILTLTLCLEKDESICESEEALEVDPDQCCKIPVMVDEKLTYNVMMRVMQDIQQGNANLAMCKAIQYALEYLKILNDGKYDLSAAIKFAYESLEFDRSLADVWSVAATDCFDLIKGDYIEQYQQESGFSKEICDVKSEVFLFCMTTRVTVVSFFNKFLEYY